MNDSSGRTDHGSGSDGKKRALRAKARDRCLPPTDRRRKPSGDDGATGVPVMVPREEPISGGCAAVEIDDETEIDLNLGFMTLEED